MAPEIPCPVEGCDEVFQDEAAVIAHMKDAHGDEFAPPGMQTVDPPEPPEPQEQVEKAVLGVPPEVMTLLDARIDERIDAALEKFKPELQTAVAGAIKKVVDQAQAAGIQVPGVTGEGGVVKGSALTPTGAALINAILKGGGGSDMEQLAKTLTQARAISDVLNPPSIWDRVMQNAVLRSLRKADLVTESEMKELLEPPAKPKT